MGNPLISIVVPIYNVEQYLDRCVDSLINQTMRDIEIILVDDGSPDNCPQMCNEYATRDQRVRVIHKKNGGLSDARNIGINSAKGEYILFVDSDDYIETNACAYFANIIFNQKVDVVIGGAKKITGSNIEYMGPLTSLYKKPLTGKEYLKLELKYNYIRMAVWLNLYHRKFLIENNLFFKEGLLHEDEQWTPRVLLKAHKVFVMEYYFYNYIIRKDSISKAKDFKKNAEHIISIVFELNELYEQLSDIELKKLLNNYLVTLYLFAFKEGNIQKESKELLRKNFVLKYATSYKNKIKSIIFYFSPKLYSWIGNIKV